MKCSECGNPIRAVVAVDIDGTLGNYHEHFVAFAEQYVGHRLRTDFAGDIEFRDHLSMDLHTYREVKLAFRQGGLKRSMPAYPGAVDFMRWLKDHDLEIWIATTRPWMRLDNIDPDTRHWLTRHEIPYDYLIYGEDKYHQLVERVDRQRVIAVIDDLREQLDVADELGLPAYQPERAHNRNDQYHLRFRSFRDMKTVIETTMIGERR